MTTVLAALKGRLKESRIAPTLRSLLRVYRVGLLYPFRRTRNFVVNTVELRLYRAWWLGIRRHGWRHRATVGFTPHQPNQTSQIWRIMLMNRYRMARPDDPEPDIRIYWAYGAGYVPPTASWTPVINAGCRDISKRHVDAVHQQVFGYELSVDPLTHHGEAFVKSDANAVHDGHIELLPVAHPQSGVVYQRLVHNDLPDGTREDIRIPFVNGLLPYVYLVYRRLDNIISGKLLDRSQMKQVDEILSPSEQSEVERFCQALGLQFGELDAVRDKHDGRLHIIDANRAVGVSIQPRERGFWKQLTTISEEFDRCYNPRSH